MFSEMQRQNINIYGSVRVIHIFFGYVTLASFSWASKEFELKIRPAAAGTPPYNPAVFAALGLFLLELGKNVPANPSYAQVDQFLNERNIGIVP